MTVNVGTAGHIDNKQRVLITDGGGISAKLAVALAHAMISPSMDLPALPRQKPARAISQRDLDAIACAESKRQRRVEHNRIIAQLTGTK